MTTSTDRAATARWLDANLASVAEFNAARKILTRQLEAVSIGLASIDDLHAVAAELQATALLLRALAPIPQPIAASHFRAAFAAFGNAVGEILRDTTAESASGTAVANGVAVLMLQATAHYRAATEAIKDGYAPRVGAGSIR